MAVLDLRRRSQSDHHEYEYGAMLDTATGKRELASLAYTVVTEPGNLLDYLA
jgi:hypothetical protein